MPARRIAGMRNREAARYARWSAWIALVICLFVLVVYLHRQRRDRRQEKKFAPAPSSVAEQSAGFAFSRAIGPRTIFTVRASQATEFKDPSRSLLENVDITIFGPRGDRNDSVHAGECSYDPPTGDIRCQGAVQIDLRSKKSATMADASGKNSVHLDTSDILFSHESVTTDKPVRLRFSGGEGSGVGLLYEPETENATLEKNVELEMSPPRKSDAAPIRVSSGRMEFHRAENVLRFSGPVRVEQNSQTLSSGLLQLELDAAMRPVGVLATDHPAIVARGARQRASLAADQIAAELSPQGQVRRISANAHVRGDSAGPGGQNRFSAEHAQMVMRSTGSGSQPREILAQGNVDVETVEGRRHGHLATESVRVELSPDPKGGDDISGAETLAPGKLTMVEPGGKDELEGRRLTAVFGAQNRLTALQGSSGVRVERWPKARLPETSVAESLLARWAPDGSWETIDERGHVQFRQGDRSGTADSAELLRASNEVILSGSASVENSSWRLQAAEIGMNQTTHEMRASGNVAASFTSWSEHSGSSGDQGEVQISSDEMEGLALGRPPGPSSPTAGGHAIFTGHARFWQGSDVLQAQSIEFWQAQRRAQARGEVLGAFVEAPRPERLTAAAGGTGPVPNAAPVLWQVRAPQVDYSSDSGNMKWTGGVKADSSEGTIESQTAELYFSPRENNQQALERATAEGHVRIEQNGRTGRAERGEYLAREGKFILSGGKPTLADSSGNSTTGRQLTFFLANDAVLVGSQQR